jgi:hypothetical protein
MVHYDVLHSKFMYPLYKKIQPVLIENKFNFDY